MADYPFLIPLQTTLTANGRASLSYQVPNNEEIEIRDMLISSTGAFDLISINQSGGLFFSNASEGVPIKSTHLQNAANQNNHISPFPIPLVVKAGNSIEFALKDTSGAGNTVNLLLSVVRKTQN